MSENLRREKWANWPAMPPGTWAVLVEATEEDMEDCPDYGVATVILWPPKANPTDVSAIFDASCCFFSEDNSALDTDEIAECIAEGLGGDKPIFLYFDDIGDAVTCLVRLRALGCAEAAT
jgi:hypothetical protein